MEVFLQENTLKLDETAYTIICPAFELTTVFACMNSLRYMTLYSDSAGLLGLATLFLYASQNPERLTYLPLRKHGLTHYLAHREGEQSAKDIVLVHQNMQLDINLWGSLRMATHMRAPIEQRVPLSEAFPETNPAQYRIVYYHENKDCLYLRETMETLFFVASSKVFRSIANDCMALSKMHPDKLFERIPDNRALEDSTHNRNHSLRDILFTIEFYDKHLWGE